MERKSNLSKLLNWVIMLVLICTSIIGSTATVNAEGELYYGYRPAKGAAADYYWPLWVRDGGEQIAYCYNGDADWPATMPQNSAAEGIHQQNGWMFSKIANASSADMTKYAAGTSTSMKSNVLRVVFNGFPYNASGIKQKHGISASQLREVTQAAVWAYTDGTSLNLSMTKLRKLFDDTLAKPRWSQSMVDAYADLIGQGTTTLINPPSDFALDLYIAQSYGTEAPIQNLLAVRLDDVVTEVMDIPVEKKWSGATPAGAEVTVKLYANNQEIDSVKLKESNNWKHTFTNLPKNDLVKYTVDETSVSGYTKSISGTAATGFVITNTQNGESVKVSKVDIGGDEIAGAKLEIRDTSNNVVEKWTSVDGTTHTATVKPGEYTLNETTAPSGYEIAKSIRFKVDNSGNITVYNAKTDQFEAATGLKMVDEYSDQEVEISKVDIGGDEVAGAELEIFDKDNNSKAKWTSVANQNKTVKLQPGEYTLKENVVPAGYEKADDIRFTVDKDGNVKVFNTETNKFEAVTNVKMVDEYVDQEIEISKVDVGGDEIEGAKLEIFDKDNNSKAKWTSVANENKTVKLKPGEYTLKETTAPNGYEIANDIRFSVDKDGNVKVYNAEKQQFEAADKVKMVDEYSDQEVEISKVDIGGDEVEGAELEIVDKDNNSKAKWTSVADQNKTVKLKPGVYTLKENLVPVGYAKASDILFSVDKEGTVKVYNAEKQAFETATTVKMVDKYSDQDVKVSKVDIGGEEIEGAELEITDKDSKSVAKWTSVANETKTVQLQPGEYTLTEKLAPKGYEKANEIRFTIDKDSNLKVYNEENDEFEKVDKVKMVDEYSDQEIGISKVNLKGKKIAGAQIEIFDEEGNTVDEWTSKKDKTHKITLQPGSYTFHEVSAPNGYKAVTDIDFSVDHEGKITVLKARGNTVKVDAETGELVVTDQYAEHGTKSVDTGDGSNLLLNIIAMIGAMMLMGGVWVYRRN